MHNDILGDNKIRNPYYIFAPSYINTSAGVKALHLLCHHLNLKGYPSFLVTNGDYYYKINPELISPILTPEVMRSHKETNKTPIAVYPDIVKGNPLNSKCTVRYLLHYAGFLGGDREFTKEDLIFTYTKKIGQKMGIEEPQVLFMPICNTDIFYPPADKTPRKGSCFYASKYRGLSGNEPFEITKDSIEITRDLPTSQTTEEVADLLRRSECFYTYEDTSLITEAILCGCPVVFVKNKFFDGEPLAINEVGSEGCSIDINNKNIEQARQTIDLAQKKFFDSVEKFWSQLDNFITLTQELSLKTNSGEFSLKFIPTKKKHMPLGRILKMKCKSLIKFGS